MKRIAIVGGGAAGAALAARLSEDPDREIILIEAGPADSTPPELLDGATMPAAQPGHPANWAYKAELMPESTTVVPRGKILGGSSTINGGYFVRPRLGDLSAWSEARGEAWSAKRALPVLAAIENDLDYGSNLGHGASGPIRIRRPAQDGELTSAFTRAALELGFPAEADKNALETSPGVGPAPSNIIDGVRVNSALAYLNGATRRPNLQVIGNTRVLRARIDGGRAVGVETEHGVIDADEIVLCAGSVATPQLLMLSGIGPADDLDEFGIPVVADLPVGDGFSDHPNLAVEWQPARPVLDAASRYPFPTALNFSSGAEHPDGDIEILLASKPFSELFSAATDPAPMPTIAVMQFLVSLQAPESRGSLRLQSADPLQPPRIEYRYLEDAGDRERLRFGVRTAAAILRSESFAGIFASFAPRGDDVLADAILADDERLDAWIRARLGTAIHLCGTAPMGPVVDGAGRVHGVPGLRVADTSILPVVPSRGTFASAVLVGEIIARAMRTEG